MQPLLHHPSPRDPMICERQQCLRLNLLRGITVQSAVPFERRIRRAPYRWRLPRWSATNPFMSVLVFFWHYEESIYGSSVHPNALRGRPPHSRRFGPRDSVSFFSFNFQTSVKLGTPTALSHLHRLLFSKLPSHSSESCRSEHPLDSSIAWSSFFRMAQVFDMQFSVGGTVEMNRWT